MHPLPLVTLIIGLFLLCSITLAGLIAADHVVERRLKPARQDALQLNLDSLIRELTIYA